MLELLVSRLHSHNLILLKQKMLLAIERITITMKEYSNIALIECLSLIFRKPRMITFYLRCY